MPIRRVPTRILSQSILWNEAISCRPLKYVPSNPTKSASSVNGAEGWELVGEGPLEIRTGGLRALYFKRPKL
jgi:hypothetical protein